MKNNLNALFIFWDKYHNTIASIGYILLILLTGLMFSQNEKEVANNYNNINGQLMVAQKNHDQKEKQMLDSAELQKTSAQDAEKSWVNTVQNDSQVGATPNNFKAVWKTPMIINLSTFPK